VTEESLVIDGNLYKPEGNGPFPAIIVLHGCAGIDYHFRSWAEQLKKWGYVALIVDSFGPRGVDRVCGKSFRVPDLERAADSYGAAIYLKQLPYVDGENIGLIGFSHGGWSGLRAVQRNFPYTVNMDTIPFKAAVLFYPSCNSRQHQEIAIPTLIMIGSKDDWTPAARCVELNKWVTQPEMLELVVYEGAYHDFDRQKKGYRTYLGHVLKYDVEATKDSKERTKAFFDKHLLIK
jgi:dienelactone hydrolase